MAMALERLQKIIARSGLASRRQAEQWILEGRVSVNGTAVQELGSKADPSVSRIQVDGKPVRFPRRLVYLALHKPRSFVTTRSDPQGRPTVMHLIKGIEERLYPVGRLDYASEGLLLLTNDGEFAHRVTSAASGIAKTYWAKVGGVPTEQNLHKLRQGIVLDGRRTRPARIHPLPESRRRLLPGGRKGTATAWYEVTLQEGKQNQIRRMFERIGHPVRKLKRVQIGNVPLGDLPPGAFRPLTVSEVTRLLRQTGSEQRLPKGSGDKVDVGRRRRGQQTKLLAQEQD
jgi:pseudouridine synthase